MTVRHHLCCLAIAAAAVAPLSAQRTLPHPALTLEGARAVIAATVAEAHRLKTTGVVAVVDDGGNLMALERLDDTFAAGANISIGKARTAALFKRPTRVFEDLIRNGRTAMVALNDFTPLQGGVPIMVDGAIVGAVGVSGAASAAQDDSLASLGSLALAGAAMAAAQPVQAWGHDDVAAAFAKGGVLFDGAGGTRNYMVHASRRESTGQVEVHTRDTDIIYVQGGSARFVTGGTMVDGKTVAPDEIRGARIQGGDVRQIAKGDVLIVPNGTPHWFEAVNGPLTYYVVKVR